MAGHGGGDIEAFGISLAAITSDHFSACHLGDIRRAQFGRGDVIARVDHLGKRFLVAGLVDTAQAIQAAENPVAALLGSRRVDQRVVARRCFRQAGDHRHLRQVELADRFAVIHLCGSFDAVSAVAEVDLVDVELEDFVLAQLALDLQSQEDFGGLA